MFDRLNTPQELYNYKLGAALKMENTVLEMLGDDIEAARSDEVEGLLRHHEQETRGHVEILEQVFGCFEWEVDDSSCPAIEGIQKEGKATVKMTDDSLVDVVILMGAAATEHHEIAVYEGLIVNARAMGRNDVVDLLQQNLESERHTLEEVKRTLTEVASAKARKTTA